MRDLERDIRERRGEIADLREQLRRRDLNAARRDDAEAQLGDLLEEQRDANRQLREEREDLRREVERQRDSVEVMRQMGLEGVRGSEEEIAVLRTEAELREVQLRGIRLEARQRINELGVALENERRAVQDAPSRDEYRASREREAALRAQLQDLVEQNQAIRENQQDNADLRRMASDSSIIDGRLITELTAENERLANNLQQLRQLEMEVPELTDALRLARAAADRPERPRPQTSESGVQATRGLNPDSPEFQATRRMNPTSQPFEPPRRLPISGAPRRVRSEEPSSAAAAAAVEQPQPAVQGNFDTFGDYVRATGRDVQGLAQNLRTMNRGRGGLDNIGQAWARQYDQNPMRFVNRNIDQAVRQIIQDEERGRNVNIRGPRGISYNLVAAAMANQNISAEDLFQISPSRAEKREASRAGPAAAAVAASPAMLPSKRDKTDIQGSSPAGQRSRSQEPVNRRLVFESPGAAVSRPGAARSRQPPPGGAVRSRVAEIEAREAEEAKKKKSGRGRWTDYGGPNFSASTAKVYKQISRGGARKPRRPKSAPGFMDYEDECNDPNETGMGYSGGKSEMMATENKHAYMDKNWAGLPKVWSVGKGVKLRNAHYKPKERY
jgi:hypothetical protein